MSTQDIKPSWLNPIRAAQAVCKDNRGLAIITLRILVDKNDPVRWLEPRIEKVHPLKARESNTNNDILSALFDVVDNNIVDT